MKKTIFFLLFLLISVSILSGCVEEKICNRIGERVSFGYTTQKIKVYAKGEYSNELITEKGKFHWYNGNMPDDDSFYFIPEYINSTLLIIYEDFGYFEQNYTIKTVSYKGPGKTRLYGTENDKMNGCKCYRDSRIYDVIILDGGNISG